MTTDPFIDAARAEAERKFGDEVIAIGWKAVFMDAAEWARTHLAAQEPTDAECAAVLDVKYGGPVGPDDEPYDEDDMAEARAALSAARAARRDEEKQ